MQHDPVTNDLLRPGKRPVSRRTALVFGATSLLIAAAAAPVVILTPGCGGSGSDDGQPTDGAGRSVLATGRFDVLQFTLHAKPVYAPGESVVLRFSVQNTGRRPIEVVLGPPYADAQARSVSPDENGPVVWTWSADKIFPAVIETLRFAPGESRAYELEWPSAQPGTYEVNAWFNGSHVQFVQPPDPRTEFNAGPARIIVR